MWASGARVALRRYLRSLRSLRSHLVEFLLLHLALLLGDAARARLLHALELLLFFLREALRHVGVALARDDERGRVPPPRLRARSRPSARGLGGIADGLGPVLCLCERESALRLAWSGLIKRTFWIFWMRSSMESLTTKRVISTFLVWPRRCTRPIACASCKRSTKKEGVSARKAA